MRSSRDVGLLRDDVEHNCRTFLALCEKAGYHALVTGTVRDEEYQLKCYSEGKSKSKVPTFHSMEAGLAFDYCQNIKGLEYEAAFYAATAPLAKEMGFTWGGDWKTIVDKPHLQWDAHGTYSGADILKGNYPPEMPAYPAEADTGDAETEEEDMVRYQKLGDIPNEYGFRDVIEALMDAGIINGDGSDPDGNGDVIDLSHDQVRSLVFEYRGGAFDRKLMAEGATPAVEV